MALIDSLISFFELEEASGIRVDKVTASANDLTDNNTVTQAAGKVGNAAQFTAANSESLSRPSNALLQTGDIDFSAAAWVYMDSKPSNAMTILGKYQANHREYHMEWNNGTDTFRMVTSPDLINGIGNASAAIFGSPALATWHYVVIWHDATLHTDNICVNAGSSNAGTDNGGMQTDTISAFAVGTRDIVSAGNFWNGRIDQIGFWKKILSAAEITQLYNNGNGLSYAQMIGGIGSLDRNGISRGIGRGLSRG